MAQRGRFSNRRKQARAPAPAPVRRPLPSAPERKAPTQYGKPFVLLEDENSNTFAFKAGAWIPHTMSIAECRESCQVTKLPQKVNRMTRYEVRCPVSIDA